MAPGSGGGGRVGARFREFSPAHNIKKGAPPTIVFLGDKDELNNRWLEEQAVPDMNATVAIATMKNAKPACMDEVKAIWIVFHFGSKARV